jgi:tRNA threonylcarbamoyladenosine biosynthesis protein TsaB
VSTILCIDTASAEIAVALAFDGAIVASVSRDATMQHSQVLLATIAGVLGGRRQELTGIAVVRGPGNYAGLRVGLATAQGLALSLSVPIRGISTLEAAARAGDTPDCLAIHPAGRGEFAAQRFRHGAATDSMHVATAEEFARRPHPSPPSPDPGEGEQHGMLAGEGAGAFGGIEVTPDERCRAALLALIGDFDSGANAEVDAVYLREPNITLPRAKPAAAVGR